MAEIYFSQFWRLGSPTQIKASEDSASDKSLLLGSYMSVFLLWKEVKGGGSELSGVSFIRVLIPFMRPMSS